VRATLRIHLRGFVFLLLLAAVGTAAVVKGNNLLFLIFSALGGVFASSLVLTFLTPRKLEIERILPEAVFAGEPFELRLRVRNGKRFVPAFALRFQDRVSHENRPVSVQPPPASLAYAGPGEGVTIGVPTIALQRGRALLGPLRIVSEFPPGLATSRAEVPTSDEILVFPRRAILMRRAMSALLARLETFDMEPAEHTVGEQEFAGLREFRPGDNLRHIHWKMSARMPGRLLVREFEATRVRRAVLLLETYLPDARRANRLERAISFAAALAETLLAERYSVSVRVLVPDLVVQDAEPGRGAPMDLYATLALLRPNRSAPLADLLHRQNGSPDEAYFVLRCGDTPLPGWAGEGRAVVLSPAEIRASMRFLTREEA